MAAPVAAPSLSPLERDMLERGRVPLGEAIAYLGMSRQAANPKAKRYLKRTYELTKSGRPFDTAKLRPERNAAGEYTEVPCYKTQRGFMVRADLLLPMVRPELGWPV